MVINILLFGLIYIPVGFIYSRGVSFQSSMMYLTENNLVKSSIGDYYLNYDISVFRLNVKYNVARYTFFMSSNYYFHRDKNDLLVDKSESYNIVFNPYYGFSIGFNYQLFQYSKFSFYAGSNINLTYHNNNLYHKQIVDEVSTYSYEQQDIEHANYVGITVDGFYEITEDGWECDTEDINITQILFFESLHCTYTTTSIITTSSTTQKDITKKYNPKYFLLGADLFFNLDFQLSKNLIIGSNINLVLLNKYIYQKKVIEYQNFRQYYIGIFVTMNF